VLVVVVVVVDVVVVDDVVVVVVVVVVASVVVVGAVVVDCAPTRIGTASQTARSARKATAKRVVFMAAPLAGAPAKVTRR
jgi:hypothetical protein